MNKRLGIVVIVIIFLSPFLNGQTTSERLTSHESRLTHLDQRFDSLINAFRGISPVQPENGNLQFGVMGPTSTLLDPAILNGLTTTQMAFFSGMDVLVTGTLLGGRSKGIHSIIMAIINSVEKYRGWVK